MRTYTHALWRQATEGKGKVGHLRALTPTTSPHAHTFSIETRSREQPRRVSTTCQGTSTANTIIHRLTQPVSTQDWGGSAHAVMDASTLSALIDSSSIELEKLHKKLGCPAEELERAIAALKTCIHDAIHAQIRHVEAQVAEVQASCDKYKRQICLLCEAIGTSAHVPPGSSLTGQPQQESSLPLLAQQEALVAEQARLEAMYKAQCEQCDLVISQIDTLNGCMSDAGGTPSMPTQTETVSTLRDVTPSTVQHLEAHLVHVQQVYKERKMQMESHLTEILQLWSELHIMPHVAVHAGRVSVHEDGSEESRFHMSILQYTQQVPTMELDGQFYGQFQTSSPSQASSSSYAASRLPAALSADEDSAMLATPTRAQGAPMLVLHESHTECDAPAAVPDLLQPTDTVMAQSVQLREALEREKAERESSIQAYYDELCELWMRFDVPETEMDAFVLDHRGSTLQVVQAYRIELDKMRSLKSQHMALFITKTREQIWEQWDALYMSDKERQESFPAYFLALPGEEDMLASTFDWDELLAEHEHMYAKLTEMLEQRAPILSLIGRYHAICNEARALEESAQDGARLLGRGNRGDPGRLLREEKMRKRVKIQKPKLEQELLKVLPAWEETHHMPFMMDGVRFVDHLRDQLGGAPKENPRVQRRVPGTSATSVTGNAAPAPAESLRASRSANGVPATPRNGTLTMKRPAHAFPGAPPTQSRRAGGPGATTRSRVASQSRMTPYGPVGATPSARMHDAKARRFESTSSAATVVQRMTSSSNSSQDESFAAAQRTPSTHLASSLAHAQTPFVSR